MREPGNRPLLRADRPDAGAAANDGHRGYAPEHVQRLRFIRRAREFGFGLDAIRRLIALSEPGVQVCCEVRDMAREHVLSIDARIADLQPLRGVLRHAVADCRDGETVRCPVMRYWRLRRQELKASVPLMA